MALTQVDSGAALIVIDLQKGVAGIAAAHPFSEIVARSAQLARAFRERGLPVVLVNVTGAAPGRTDVQRPKRELPADWSEFVPELERQPSDFIVSKQRVGAFIGTSLDEYLHQRGVTQVFLTGVASSFGVESTGRSAYDYGYNVVYVMDAMTDRSGDAHQYCAEKVFPRIGETETTENVFKALRAAKVSARE